MTVWGTTTLALYGAGGAALATSLAKLRQRLQLSQANTSRLPAMPAWPGGSRRFVPFYAYDDLRFLFRRRAREHRPARPAVSTGFRRSTTVVLRKPSAAPPKRPPASPTCNSPTPIGSRSSTAAICAPAPAVRPRSCSRVPASPLPISTTIVFYDVSGSYGVNVLGYDFYKQGHRSRLRARVRALGPVLGPYHPLVLDNVQDASKEISGL